VRPAIPADIPAMMALETHAITAAHWSRQQYEQVFGAREPRRQALVIETDGIQGFLVARALDKEWEIENMAVSGPARRLGLGTRLLGEFLDEVRVAGAQGVFLEVRESNHAARALYEKWAFVQIGRRKGYYRGPEEDAITYCLDLA
jgi:[ribosomal protein S18]-alanine N-acetyltransferase